MEPSLETGDRGTLPFAAPEVARGEATPSQASDVYALAAALLFLATGAPIVEAEGDAAMLLEIGERGVRRDLCDRAEGLSDSARAALRQALAPDPEERIATARALAEALAGPPETKR
jgi:serine/threonine protein kinase